MPRVDCVEYDVANILNVAGELRLRKGQTCLPCLSKDSMLTLRPRLLIDWLERTEMIEGE